METDPMTSLIRDRAAARAAGDPLVDVCFLATASADGQPSVRALSLRHVDEAGIGVLVSDRSAKWQELEHSGRYELLCLWKSVERQYRIQGERAPMPDAQIHAYWERKSHGSRLLDRYYVEVAPQSTPVASREAFLAGVAKLRERYPTPEEVPRPDALRGLLFVPDRIEVWEGSPADRLHHRVVHRRTERGWSAQVIVP